MTDLEWMWGRVLHPEEVALREALRVATDDLSRNFKDDEGLQNPLADWLLEHDLPDLAALERTRYVRAARLCDLVVAGHNYPDGPDPQAVLSCFKEFGPASLAVPDRLHRLTASDYIDGTVPRLSADKHGTVAPGDLVWWGLYPRDRPTFILGLVMTTVVYGGIQICQLVRVTGPCPPMSLSSLGCPRIDFF